MANNRDVRRGALLSGRAVGVRRRLLNGALVLAISALLMGTTGVAIAAVPTAAAAPAPKSPCAIPGVAATAAAPAPAVAGVFDGVPLSAAQVGTAQSIVAVATEMQIARRGARIAIAVALQESSLNPAAVNGPYIGLFQQKTDTSSGLYTGGDRTKASDATRMFFEQLVKRVPHYDTDARPDWQVGEVVQETNAGRNVLQWFGVSDALNNKLNPLIADSTAAAAKSAAVAPTAAGSLVGSAIAGLIVLPRKAAATPSGASTINRRTVSNQPIAAFRYFVAAAATPALPATPSATATADMAATTSTSIATTDLPATTTTTTGPTAGTTATTSGGTVTVTVTSTAPVSPASATATATTAATTATTATTVAPTTATTTMPATSTTPATTPAAATTTATGTATTGPTTAPAATTTTAPSTTTATTAATTSAPRTTTVVTTTTAATTRSAPVTSTTPSSTTATPTTTTSASTPAPSPNAGHHAPPVVDTKPAPVPTGTNDDPNVGAGAPGSTTTGGSSSGNATPTPAPLDCATDLRSTTFDPGMIISDAVFYNTAAMTAAQIRGFINAQGAACTGPECLKNVRITSADRPADRYCSAYRGGTNEDFATVLAKLSVSCGINPQVMLVTLQKESALLTRTDVTSSTYAAAYGWHCPDTGPGGTANCDPQYAGLFNQAAGMAKQWARYRLDPQKYNYHAGQTTTILWNVVQTQCGGSSVYIRNTATASLYNYTPYQPNAAALAAYPGVGDRCSAYGNRNFFFLFQKYFGSTGGGAAADVSLNGVQVTIPVSAHVAAGAAGQVVVAPTAAVAKGLAAGLAAIGLPYVYGGGTNGGGADQGCSRAGGALNSCQGTVGFDCSGLTGYVLTQAGFRIPDYSGAQRSAGTDVPWAQGRPGDIIGYNGHVAIYLGLIKGIPYLLEAPDVGMYVQVRPVYFTNGGVPVDSVLHRYWA